MFLLPHRVTEILKLSLCLVHFKRVRRGDEAVAPFTNEEGGRWDGIVNVVEKGCSEGKTLVREAGGRSRNERRRSQCSNPTCHRDGARGARDTRRLGLCDHCREAATGRKAGRARAERD